MFRDHQPRFTSLLRTTAVALLCGVLSGCAATDQEFYWRRDDGEGFVLRYALDLAAKQISFEEQQFPADGQPAPPTRKVRNIDDCQFSDARNWHCEDRGMGDETIYMIDGELHYNFLTEHRRYALRNVLRGRLQPCLDGDLRGCGRALRAMATFSS